MCVRLSSLFDMSDPLGVIFPALATGIRSGSLLRSRCADAPKWVIGRLEKLLEVPTVLAVECTPSSCAGHYMEPIARQCPQGCSDDPYTYFEEGTDPSHYSIFQSKNDTETHS